MDHDEGASLAPPAPPGERDGRSVCHVVHPEGSGEVHFSREIGRAAARAEESSSGSISSSRSAGDFEILRDVFGFHPLAVEDSEQFGQRAKIDEYDDFVLPRHLRRAADEDTPGRGALLLLGTLPGHRAPRRLPARSTRSGAATRSARSRSSTRRCCSTGSSTASSTASSRSSPTSTTASTSWRTRSSAGRRCASSRRSVRDEAPARRHAQGGHACSATRSRASWAASRSYPGSTDEDERYFRDVYDHLIRISDLIDSYRDLLTGAMDVVPVDGLEPPEQRHEAADDHRHDLPAADLADRLLRPELRLPGPPHRGLGRRSSATACSWSWSSPPGCSPTSSGVTGSDAKKSGASAASRPRLFGCRRRSLAASGSLRAPGSV